jgi:O-antigen ligase
VLKAFLVSCTLLMALSWICFFEPALKISSTLDPGVPVKNYIDQSQEFAFCQFALAPLVLVWMKSQHFFRCAAAFLLIVAFFANMMFVASARTALVYIPVLLVVFALTHLRPRSIAILLIGALLAGALIWVTSPYIRYRVEKVSSEYKAYRSTNAVTSTGERLEFWRKSLRFVSDSPLIGNGTGSTKTLFERDALGQSGVSAKIIGNPHNQTLNVAVQWGLVGVLVLYTMWLVHLLLFRGTGMVAWIGTLVVLQNFVSSIFNSHLFDFHEGWMYVLGVGVAGGAMLRHLNISTEEATPQVVLSLDLVKPSSAGQR